MTSPPFISISDPVRLKDGRYRVDAVVSDVPGYIHRFNDPNPENADAKARSFSHERLWRFHKSEAAKHARAKARIDQALKARQRANMGAVAG